MSGLGVLRTHIKELIIERLKLTDLTSEMIEDEAPLIGDQGPGLDSVDVLELVVAIEKEFGLRIEDGDETREAFSTVTSLADFIAARLSESKSQSP